MHVGRTSGVATPRPMFMLSGGPDGAVSADGRVMGSYIHGMFAEDALRHAFLSRLRARAGSDLAYDAMVESTLDGLARHLEQHLDVEAILAIARGEDRSGDSAANKIENVRRLG